MLTILLHKAIHWLEERRRRAQLRTLLAYDDEILEDIGFVRTEIQSALGAPMHVDAMAEARCWSQKSLLLDRRAVSMWP